MAIRCNRSKRSKSYTEATCSNLLRLAALILDGAEAAASRDAALHAGIAYGITGLIRALPWHCARGQVFVPAEILQAHGANRDDFAAGRASPGGPGRACGSARSCSRASRYFLCQAPRLARQKPSGVLARLPLRALSAADGKAWLRTLQDRRRAAAMAKAMDSLARCAPVGLAARQRPRQREQDADAVLG